MSKTALAILGLASENPKHGYEILQDIKLRKMDMWVRISTASVYNTLARLEKQKYISETKIKFGKMPERNVYNVTPKGMRYLCSLVEQFLAKDIHEGYHFRLAVAFINHIEPQKALRILYKRRNAIEKVREDLKREYQMLSNEIPYNWLTIMQSGVSHMNAEIELTRSLIEHLEKKEPAKQNE